VPIAPRKNLPVAGQKSCVGCPSNLTTGQQGGVIGRSIGGPVCASKNIPLGRPGLNNHNKTMQHFAKNCNLHGVEVDFGNGTAEKKPVLLQIAMPDPNARESDNWQAEPVSSCTGCHNYVPPRLVDRLTGWRAGWCRSSGSLLLEDRLTVYARDCTSRRYIKPEDRLNELGTSTGNVNIILLPEYGPDFGLPKKVDPNKVHEINLITKPSDYNSDAQVKESHKAMGIRAFRRIEDPKAYGAPILIPIMDEHGTEIVDGVARPVFTDDDRSRIPRSGSSENPEAYFDHNGAAYRILTMWLRLKLTPAVWGMAGTGKTELLRHLAWMMGMPFQRISITETSDLEDLFGKMRFSKEKGTYFQYGRVPNAWRRPNVLCLDEPNTGPAAVWQRIRPLTDDSKQLALDENEAEIIPQHRLCYLAMAMNPAWDVRNTGAFPLAAADGSRLMHIEMPLPPEDIETKILLETLKRDRWEKDEAVRQVATLMRIAKELRDMSDTGAIPITWGIRDQKKVVRVRRFARWEDAFRMGVIDALEPQVRDLILNVVRSHDDEAD
jgi:MoxR-like ATPase